MEITPILPEIVSIVEKKKKKQKRSEAKRGVCIFKKKRLNNTFY